MIKFCYRLFELVLCATCICKRVNESVSTMISLVLLLDSRIASRNPSGFPVHSKTVSQLSSSIVVPHSSWSAQKMMLTSGRRLRWELLLTIATIVFIAVSFRSFCCLSYCSRRATMCKRPSRPAPRTPTTPFGGVIVTPYETVFGKVKGVVTESALHLKVDGFSSQ